MRTGVWTAWKKIDFEISMQAVEVAKSRRAPTDGNKAKPREKKGKEQEAIPIYDYHDASIHDANLRVQLSQGYEQFKVKDLQCHYGARLKSCSSSMAHWQPS